MPEARPLRYGKEAQSRHTLLDAHLGVSMAVADFLTLFAAGVFTAFLLIGRLGGGTIMLAALTAGVSVALFAVTRVYARPWSLDPRRGLHRSLGGWCCAVGVLLAVEAAILVPHGTEAALSAEQAGLSRPFWEVAFAVVGALVLTARRSAAGGSLPSPASPPFASPPFASRGEAWTSESGGQPVFLVGDLRTASATLRALRVRPAANLDPMGLFLTDSAGGIGAVQGVPVLGRLEDVPEAVAQTGVATVILAAPHGGEPAVTGLWRRFQAAAADVYVAALPSGGMSETAPLRLRRLSVRPLDARRTLAKAAVDYGLGGLLTLAVLPAMAVIALAVRLESRGPVLFRQMRTGLNGQPITVYKFRSMYHEMGDVQAKVATRQDDPRVTRVGAVLRRTSLDELPQLLNVMQGRMSLVGPRPHAPASRAGGLLFPEADAAYEARHRVKPGVTGLAQVNGWRGTTDTRRQLQERVRHDLWYVENWTPWLDLKIILKTPFAMIGRNVY